MQLTVPPTVAQNFARAKSLLGRNEPVRALEALVSAINTFEAAEVLGRARAGVEFSIQECVDACNNHKDIRGLIRKIARSDTAAIVYVPGEEAKLVAVLGLIRKALTEAENAGQKAAEEEARTRKEAQFAAAHNAIRNGETPKGRALLRRLGEEYGSEPGALAAIGSILVEANFPHDAVPYLEQAIAAFPRESRAYAMLASCYLDLRELEKAEKLYLAAIKEFGAHPKTLTNLGKLYIQWNKKDKAFDVLRQAVRLDPDNAEIAELYAKVDR
ncbi:putative Tetratricopeptide repeat family protein [uncultured delta proteobacterium]|uniref:Putative Tetratricopeptide repeat family protein n=1 Tax=uncultured delta proteobacterium TaxID=34034 RepID=A0A212J814_9DELT|nr:putative Tetratricopeptide repeat family protein [uncultured delta proteobacterium]